MKKLKEQYRNKQEYEVFYHGKRYVRSILPNARNQTFRSFSTKQERSLYLLHKSEFRHADFHITLRARRGKALPDPWDDIISSLYGVKKSWKHNSKRRHQYHRIREA